MEWFNQLKSKAALGRVAEEKLYEDAYEELDSGRRRPGLWAKAIARSGGSEEKAKSLYIELLVQKYRDETHLRVEKLRETLRDYADDQTTSESAGGEDHKTQDVTQIRSTAGWIGGAVLWVIAALVILAIILAFE